MAAADVDVGYVSAHLGVPDHTISTAIAKPTIELVKAILQAVAAKAQSYDALEADKLQLEIEREAIVRGSEAKCVQFKETAERALKEVEGLREKLRSEENARQALENELQALRSSTLTSSSDLDTLRARVLSLETSNRETLAVLESKNAAHADLARDLQEQHEKTVKLHQEINSLRTAVDKAQASERVAKFREDTAKQELELAKQHNDWLEKELKAKSEESLKSRKEKGARIAELQRLHDDANSRIESLQRTEQQLRSRIDEAQQKAEDALTHVQQLQEAAAREREDYQQQLDSHKRVAELKDQQAQNAKDRLEELDRTYQRARDDEHHQRRVLQGDLEQEQQQRAELEKRAGELQAQVDLLEAALGSRDVPPGSAPQTPRANGSLLGRALSPFGTPASLRGRSSMVDVHEQLYNLKGQLVGEQRRSKKLQEELDDMANILEAKVPEIEELNAEAERLRNEIIQMSQVMEQAFEERDAALKDARKAKSGEASAKSELRIRETQVRDLSTQVRVLLFNIQAHEKGLDHLTEEEVAYFERVRRDELSEHATADTSDTHQFITERFVIFKNITELQAQNQELGRVIRELADKMDSAEALAAQQQAASDEKEVQRLRKMVSTLEEDVTRINERMTAHMRERDMFRRMLGTRASTADIQTAMGASGNGVNREVLTSIEQTLHVDEHDVATALRELQAQFDAYRQDQNEDRKALTEQIDRLSSEKTSLQSEVARITSQLTLAQERYSMLESNYKAVQFEKQELQNRNQSLCEEAAKHDMRTQQVAEDLVETKGFLESMRSENANLRAEKTLYREIQDRLSQDRENLAQEKSRLNDILAQQQSLSNQRELDDNEAKRRLQRQIDSLDSELATTKRRLSEETEEVKKLQLRKEFDGQQYQKRIDELTSALGQLKQENVALKTARDHLQARMSELEVEVRNAQDRAERLRPHPTPRAGASVNGPSGSDDDSTLARVTEQELEMDDLKSELELAKAKVKNAEEQSEAFKQLSRELEEELARMNEAQETLQTELNATLNTKDATIGELQQRVDALNTEMSNVTSELNSLRDSQADVARKSEDRERLLNSENQRLKEEVDSYKETAKQHQQDLRSQANIAAKAQKEYESELLKHAEAAKLLQELRADHNKLKTSAASWRAEADSAKITLDQSKLSWEERRQQFEQEVLELKARHDDAVKQNTTLHEQFERVAAQIATLQQSRTAGEAEQDGAAAATANPALEGMRDLANYLKREKEILEVQLDIKTQEHKRLQQQLDYAQSQLDDTRLKLEQERNASAQSSRNLMTHQGLMDKLNELNLIRESNTTLRNENRRVRADLEGRSAQITELEQRIQPLEARISELDLDKQFKDAEIKQLQEDRERSQKRMESILNKYGQVDPEELEALKKKVEGLESERNALMQSEERLQGKIKEAEATFEGEKTALRNRLAEQFKTNYSKVKAQRDEFQKERDALQQELNTAKEHLADLEQKLVTARDEKAALEDEIRQLGQEVQDARSAAVAQMTSTIGQEQAPVTDGQEAPAASQPDAVLAGQLEELRRELEDVTRLKDAAQAEVQSLQTQLAAALAQRDEALAQAEVAAAQAGLDSAEAGKGVAHAGLSDGERKALEQKIAEAEAKVAEAETRAREIEANGDAVVKQRSEKMKNTFNERFASMKQKLEQEAGEAKSRMQAEFDLKMEQERTIWKATSAGSIAAVSANGVPATPAKTDGTVSQSPVFTRPTINMADLNDAQTRELLERNNTVKNIVASNIRKRLDVEAKKVKEEAEAAIKADWEQKLNAAREQEKNLVEKRIGLQKHMSDTKLRVLGAKWEVVEKAAKETPQRPVIEVWTQAKDAKPIVAAKGGTPGAVNTVAAASQTAAASSVGPSSRVFANARKHSLPGPVFRCPGVLAAVPIQTVEGAAVLVVVLTRLPAVVGQVIGDAAAAVAALAVQVAT
ncbi:hypothetical protein P8C59_008689 [Phyllachora maydis]|uniref:Nucleoprotein TPR/MLP1 domain-containing protein n=1 Tax=Phyllachora maydis TaxID=1825666 RepID=A0AAD9IBX9_9PEZI|nr:hypothetical protein P8C59_008689 [Phyllachora maydis]